MDPFRARCARSSGPRRRREPRPRPARRSGSRHPTGPPAGEPTVQARIEVGRNASIRTAAGRRRSTAGRRRRTRPRPPRPGLVTTVRGGQADRREQGDAGDHADGHARRPATTDGAPYRHDDHGRRDRQRDERPATAMTADADDPLRVQIAPPRDRLGGDPGERAALALGDDQAHRREDRREHEDLRRPPPPAGCRSGASGRQGARRLRAGRAGWR